MRISIIGKDIEIRETLISNIKMCSPNHIISSFPDEKEFLKQVESCYYDVIFIFIDDFDAPFQFISELDINYKKQNVICCSKSNESCLISIKHRCSGHILLPFEVDQIKYELENLRYPIREKIKITCLDNISFIIDSQVVYFDSRKTYELFTYLLYVGDKLLTNNQIKDALWNDKKDHSSYFKKIRFEMINTLKKHYLDIIIKRKTGMLGINTEVVDIDTNVFNFYPYFNRTEE